MPRYHVHLYREMRLLFEGIGAGSHEEAAAIARNRLVYRLLAWNPHLPIFFRLVERLRC